MTLIAVLALAFATDASAQGNSAENWKDRIMSEKVAFLSIELGLTPAEAQKFWPIYNEVNKELDEAIFNVFKTFMALEEGMKAKKPEKEISKLLDNYHKALEKQRNVERGSVEKYRKVLTVEQVAKLHIGEEKLRRQQIRRLRPMPGPQR